MAGVPSRSGLWRCGRPDGRGVDRWGIGRRRLPGQGWGGAWRRLRASVCGCGHVASRGRSCRDGQCAATRVFRLSRGDDRGLRRGRRIVRTKAAPRRAMHRNCQCLAGGRLEDHRVVMVVASSSCVQHRLGWWDGTLEVLPVPGLHLAWHRQGSGCGGRGRCRPMLGDRFDPCGYQAVGLGCVSAQGSGVSLNRTLPAVVRR